MTQGEAMPPNWYPQPGGVERYWDGYQWTGQVRPAQSEPNLNAEWGAPAAAAVPRVQQWVSPKNPGLSVLGSFFLPGLGQFINGDVGKGVAFLAAFILGVILFIVVIGFLIVPMVWIWSMVDAYNSAQKWNAQHGIVS